MKRILSIVLTVIVIANLFLLVGCDDSHRKNNIQLNGTPSFTLNGTQSNSQPVAVNVLNGMTPTQLYKKFVEEYTAANSFDISITTKAILNGAPTSSSVKLKLTDYATYIIVDAVDTKMECWFFEDFSYLNLGKEKYKISNITADDIFGQDFIEFTLSSVVYDIDDSIYLQKLEHAQLYLHNNEYYCDLKFTAQEASDLGMEAAAFSERLFFNAQGKITKIVDQSNTENITILLDAYDSAMSVDEPADKELYIEQTIPDEDQPPMDLSGHQDPLLYAMYQEVFDAIKNARKFEMIVSTGGSTILFYTVVKNNQYTSVLKDGTYISRWLVNGEGYIGEHTGTAFSTEVTESFLSYFNSAKAQKDFVVGLQLHGNDMNDFSVLEKYSSSEMTLSHNNTDGTVDFYEISAHYSNGKVADVYITITKTLNGRQIFSIEYDFLSIDSVYLEDLVAPI